MDFFLLEEKKRGIESTGGVNRLNADVDCLSEEVFESHS